MNNLSWILYAADVADDLAVSLSLTLLALLPTAAVFGIIGAGKRVFRDKVEEGKAIHARILGLWWVLPLLLVIITIIPSSDTIYAIAASEYGEAALNSETGGKAIEALNAWLERQIGEQQ